MLATDDAYNFLSRSRIDLLLNPSSRQIYLTFPADSTFREDDVSNYFSIYGPVQDVRIPYQQKRMFGFVTFLYPEAVKLILAKGNPHFVCESRVLVKPYKEKDKVPNKFRKQRQAERRDFYGCSTPTALDAREAHDLDLLGFCPACYTPGARMFCNSSSHELLLRRKLEEQQQAAEQQGRRFVDLQLGCSEEYNLPDSPFASPTKKSSFFMLDLFNNGENHVRNSSSNGHLVGSTITSLDAPSFNPLFFQISR